MNAKVLYLVDGGSIAWDKVTYYLLYLECHDEHSGKGPRNRQAACLQTADGETRTVVTGVLGVAKVRTDFSANLTLDYSCKSRVTQYTSMRTL